MINEAIETLYNKVAGVYEIDTVMNLEWDTQWVVAISWFYWTWCMFSNPKRYVWRFQNPKYAPCPLLVNMVRAGKLGVKSKKVSTITQRTKRNL
jgi:3-hydroxybutyryl-CoA dehydrogenase